MKNKQLSAVLERFKKEIRDNSYEADTHKDNEMVIKKDRVFEIIQESFLEDYFTARLEEVLPKEKAINKNYSTDERRFPHGFNEAIRQTKRNAKL